MNITENTISQRSLHLIQMLVAVLVSFALLVLPSAAYASNDTAKNEIVYAKADASGSANGVYVVNYFHSNNDTTVNDPANYENVINLTDSQTLEQNDGSVAINLEGGKAFYYQGNMSSDTALPWDVSVNYSLDGNSVDANELSGASGELAIDVTITGKENSDFAKSYIVQAETSFDNDKFVIKDAGDTTTQSSGSTTTVTALGLPGETMHFKVVGDATNFSYSGLQIGALPLSLSVDLSKQNTSELSQSTDVLEDAILSASQGSSSLQSGTSSLSEGAENLASGLNEIDANGPALSKGWSSLSDGIAQAAEGGSELSSSIAGAQSSINASSEEYRSGAESLESAKAAYSTAMATAAAEAAKGSVSADTLAQINQAVQALAEASGDAGAYKALSGTADGLSDLSAGAATLDSGLSTLNSSTNEFDEGLNTYITSVGSAADGSTQLASGAETLSAGSNELNSGLSSLAAATKNLDSQIIEKAQERIDESLGKDFKNHSFVVSDNTNVAAVQFVYIVDGVSAPNSSSKSEETKAQDTSFEDRLMAVFKNMFGSFIQE